MVILKVVSVPATNGCCVDTDKMSYPVACHLGLACVSKIKFMGLEYSYA